jgi:hypothetical protein
MVDAIPLPPNSETPGAGADDEHPAYLPARMLNEFAYCPRLFHLEWVQREWQDSADTIDGTRVHRRVDAPSRKTTPGDRWARERCSGR